MPYNRIIIIDKIDEIFDFDNMLIIIKTNLKFKNEN